MGQELQIPQPEQFEIFSLIIENFDSKPYNAPSGQINLHQNLLLINEKINKNTKKISPAFFKENILIIQILG